MPAPAFPRLARLPLLVVTGLAMLLIATSSYTAKPAFAAPGDGTQIFGGAASGSAGTLTLGVGETKNYIISATVPAGGNFYGAGITIPYDDSKISVNCDAATAPASGNTIEFACNDDVADEVTIVFTGFPTASGPTTGVSGTVAFVSLPVTGVAATANAITGSASIPTGGNCINGGNPPDVITCTRTLGAITVTGGAFPWGDVNCSGTVSSVDISILTIVASGGTRPGSCTMPTDLNCSGAVTSVDISIVVLIASGNTSFSDCRLTVEEISNSQAVTSTSLAPFKSLLLEAA